MTLEQPVNKTESMGRWWESLLDNTDKKIIKFVWTSLVAKQEEVIPPPPAFVYDDEVLFWAWDLAPLTIILILLNATALVSYKYFMYFRKSRHLHTIMGGPKQAGSKKVPPTVPQPPIIVETEHATTEQFDADVDQPSTSRLEPPRRWDSLSHQVEATVERPKVPSESHKRPDERKNEPVERPKEPAERLDDTVERPNETVERPNETVERPNEPAERPNEPAERPKPHIESHKVPAENHKKTHESPKKLVVITKVPNESPNEPVLNLNEPTGSPKNSTNTKEPHDSPKKQVQSLKEHVDTYKKSKEITREQTESPKMPVEINKEPVESTKKPLEIVKTNDVVERASAKHQETYLSTETVSLSCVTTSRGTSSHRVKQIKAKRIKQRGYTSASPKEKARSKSDSKAACLGRLVVPKPNKLKARRSVSSGRKKPARVSSPIHDMPTVQYHHINEENFSKAYSPRVVSAFKTNWSAFYSTTETAHPKVLKKVENTSPKKAIFTMCKTETTVQKPKKKKKAKGNQLPCDISTNKCTPHYAVSQDYIAVQSYPARQNRGILKIVEPIKPTASIVNSEEYSRESCNIRKTATPVLSSLRGQGAFRSYRNTNQFSRVADSRASQCYVEEEFVSDEECESKDSIGREFESYIRCSGTRTSDSKNDLVKSDSQMTSNLESLQCMYPPSLSRSQANDANENIGRHNTKFLGERGTSSNDQSSFTGKAMGFGLDDSDEKKRQVLNLYSFPKLFRRGSTELNNTNYIRFQLNEVKSDNAVETNHDKCPLNCKRSRPIFNAHPLTDVKEMNRNNLDIAKSSQGNVQYDSSSKKCNGQFLASLKKPNENSFTFIEKSWTQPCVNVNESKKSPKSGQFENKGINFFKTNNSTRWLETIGLKLPIAAQADGADSTSIPQLDLQKMKNPAKEMRDNNNREITSDTTIQKTKKHLEEPLPLCRKCKNEDQSFTSLCIDSSKFHHDSVANVEKAVGSRRPLPRDSQQVKNDTLVRPTCPTAGAFRVPSSERHEPDCSCEVHPKKRRLSESGLKYSKMFTSSPPLTQSHMTQTDVSELFTNVGVQTSPHPTGMDVQTSHHLGGYLMKGKPIYRRKNFNAVSRLQRDRSRNSKSFRSSRYRQPSTNSPFNTTVDAITKLVAKWLQDSFCVVNKQTTASNSVDTNDMKNYAKDNDTSTATCPVSCRTVGDSTPVGSRTPTDVSNQVLNEHRYDVKHQPPHHQSEKKMNDVNQKTQPASTFTKNLPPVAHLDETSVLKRRAAVVKPPPLSYQTTGTSQNTSENKFNLFLRSEFDPPTPDPNTSNDQFSAVATPRDNTKHGFKTAAGFRTPQTNDSPSSTGTKTGEFCGIYYNDDDKDNTFSNLVHRGLPWALDSTADSATDETYSCSSQQKVGVKDTRNHEAAAETFGPGVRHILMKLRETGLGDDLVSTQHDHMRITLRKSSDVTGIIVKFQKDES